MIRWNARFTAAALAALVILAHSPAAFAAPGDGITGTAHDFTLFNTGTNPNTVAVGKCTFCHTPHKAQQTALIWNHTLSTNAYTWDNTTTIGGTPLAGIATTWNGASKLCLSCHDGSVAIGDVAWFDKAAHTGASAINTRTMAADFPNSQIATAAGALNKNHPVAHPFPFSGAASTYNGSTSGAAAVASGWVADPALNGIRLFNQSGVTIAVGGIVGSTGIECSSCHDPHNGSGVQDDYFLRGELTGNGANYICTKCHSK